MLEFRNPILSGFHPDPSICRVGEDYYLVNSSFDYFPGIPIFHSRDLVHWRQIGHVLDRTSQLDLSGIKPSEGIFAPTIRYHDSTFYVITTMIPSPGNFVVTARSPYGPWSDPIFIEGAEGIDPSLLFDHDGKLWYVGNGSPEAAKYDGHHTIWLQELDRKTFQLTGEKFVIVDGGVDISQQPIWIEGPHLYKVGSAYYLMAAEGGTGDRHSEVIFKSDTVTGPYTPGASNPIVTNRSLDPHRSEPITCVGHGDLVETQNGEWWIVLLACRPFAGGHYNTGRETFLAPVQWVDGWPQVGRNGTLEHSYPAPNLPTHIWSDEYSSTSEFIDTQFKEPLLSGHWNTIGNMAPSAWSTGGPKGGLEIRAAKTPPGAGGSPHFIGVRLTGHHYRTATQIEFEPADSCDRAGLCIEQNNSTYYSVEVGKSDMGKVVRLVRCGIDGTVTTRAEETVDRGPVNTMISAQGGEMSFYYSQANGQWCKLGGSEKSALLSTQTAGGFVGAYAGLFASSCRAASELTARFVWFRYEGSHAQ